MPHPTIDPPRAGVWTEHSSGGRFYAAPAEPSTGPGLLVLPGTGEIDTGLLAYCDRFAGDGYSLLAAPANTLVDLALDTLRGRMAPRAAMAVIALDAGADAAIRLGENGAAAAVVVHGLTPALPSALARIECPCALHLAAPDLGGDTALAAVRALIETRPRLRLYE